MQAMVWLCIVWFRAAQFGMVWFNASYANLKQPHIVKCKIWGKNLVLHSSKYGNCHNHWDYYCLCLMAYEFPDWNSGIFNSRYFFWKTQVKQLYKIKISNTLHNLVHESPYDRTNQKEMKQVWKRRLLRWKYNRHLELLKRYEVCIKIFLASLYQSYKG
jgi:hypothetical protein